MRFQLETLIYEDNPERADLSLPAMYKFVFEIESDNDESDFPVDTYINFEDFTKGQVFVNGENLGRFWDAGPQFRLYLPGPWLRYGTNTILVFNEYQLENMPVLKFDTKMEWDRN